MAETAKGGPFKEIHESDIFVNCEYTAKHINYLLPLHGPQLLTSVSIGIYLSSKIPHVSNLQPLVTFPSGQTLLVALHSISPVLCPSQFLTDIQVAHQLLLDR
jgi:hypothetical protein